MEETRVSCLMVIMMAVMAMLLTSSHAQAVDFDIQCFVKCATSCLKTPTLLCLTGCLSSCMAPSPPSPPGPSPSPPSPSPSNPPMPPTPPKPPMPPKPPATPPTSPEAVPMPSPSGLNSCNFECAIRDCTTIETDTEKLKCMENCSKLSCDDN